MDRTESPDRLITTEKPDRFAPPEDPIELYKYDHVDERGTLRYYAGLLYFLYDNPTFLDGWKPWQRLKQFELLAILAAIVGLFFQIQATNEARQQFTEEMRFNREQWEEQRVSNAWALVAAATNPNDVGNIGAGFALETLNRKGESLKNISLPGANLIEADLEGAHLDGANLKGVALVAGNLKGAVLRHANLELADLRDANLEGASLIGANLDGAYLIGANLSGVPDLSCSQLQVASFWEHTYRDESLACGAEVPDPPPPNSSESN